MQIKGIDVSVWNGKIDWSLAKQDIDFAILRAGFGRLISQKDGQFENNYRGCKENNITFGVYWYNYATTVEDAKKEAQACIEVLKGKTFDMPVWYDIEENSVFATGKANVSKIAEVFCEALKAAGYKVGIYSSYYTFKAYFTEEVKNKYDIWLAHVGNGGYPLSQTGYPGHKEMWQYSWKGVIKGIKGDVDEDWCYKDYTSAATPDPVTPPSPVTPDKPTGGGEQIDVLYSAYIGRWLGIIKNYNETDSNGYAGIKGRAISGVSAEATKGTIRYRVHLNNGMWLGWMTRFDRANWVNGVAGIAGRNIDAIQMELVGVPGYQIEYRVGTYRTKGYLNWIRGYGAGSMGYAGIYGQNIDRIQMRIVKI